MAKGVNPVERWTLGATYIFKSIAGTHSGGWGSAPVIGGRHTVTCEDRHHPSHYDEGCTVLAVIVVDVGTTWDVIHGCSGGRQCQDLPGLVT